MSNGKRAAGGRFLLCFGAAGLAEEEEEERREGSVGSRSSSAAVLPPADEAEAQRRRRRSHRVRLSKIVRSVFFVSSLDRTKYPKRSAESCKSGPSVSRSTDEDERRPDDRETVSSPSSSTSSSSRSSSLLSSASSTEPPPKPKRLPSLLKSASSSEAVERTKEPPEGPGYSGYATGWLWLLIVGLFTMVFCGRLGAILWTSTCLYCLAPRRTRHVGPPTAGGAAGSEAPRRKGWGELEKKRVVLEGLLERNKRGGNSN